MKKSRSGKSEGWAGFIIYPVVFFLLGTIMVYLCVAPIVNPILKFSTVMLLNDKPTFQGEARDLFLNVDKATLNTSSNKITLSPEQLPNRGDRYGQIKIKNADIDAPIYFGDSDIELLNGVGTLAEGYLPGAGHTVMMTAHNSLYFLNLDQVKQGDTVIIETNYGKYVYTITGTKIASDDDKTAYDLKKKEENLVLYSCYPLNGIGLTNERYFVYATYISGPQLELIY